jgi:hypothetical protein
MSARNAAAALTLLLSTHPEVDALPFEWYIELDRTIRPFITVDHPRGEESLRLLAAALELPVAVSHFGTVEEPKAAICTEGRWGGAEWHCIAYVQAGLYVTQAPPGTVAATLDDLNNL